jgi:hypothetical protein
MDHARWEIWRRCIGATACVMVMLVGFVIPVALFGPSFEGAKLSFLQAVGIVLAMVGWLALTVGASWFIEHHMRSRCPECHERSARPTIKPGGRLFLECSKGGYSKFTEFHVDTEPGP